MNHVAKLFRRSPYGERGLKLDMQEVRGVQGPRLASLRRAWIEIGYAVWRANLGWCRSPYGERGLK